MTENLERARIFRMIDAERERQDEKWGVQNHNPDYWLSILGEEQGEVCRAVCERKSRDYREELVHVAAVAVSMLECDARRRGKNLDRWTGEPS
jgi:NTP pyrophosphatase (non-canonical NTP hydrolase)